MKTGEFTEKTVEAAINAGLEELKLDREAVKIEVVEEGSRGLFGLGAKPAVVVITHIVSPCRAAQDFLSDVLGDMGLDCYVEADEEQGGRAIKMDIKGSNLGIVIGKRGQTLDSLQYLSNIVANKNSDCKCRVIIDAQGYRERREDVLSGLARKLADKVRQNGKNIALEPMSAHERKIIHATLQDHPYVTTISEGDEPYRRVLIIRK